MLTNELVEYKDNYYYVDANGAMVKNTWVAIAADEDEEQDVDYRWYYFGPAGKAYKDSNGKTINGKKYGFDSDGKMLFGFADKDKALLNTDDDNAILNCVYYYGTFCSVVSVCSFASSVPSAILLFSPTLSLTSISEFFFT